MNFLFLTMGTIEDINLKGIYPDLLRKLRDLGHQVSVLGAYHSNDYTESDVTVDGIRMVHIVTGKTEKCNPIIKGLNMLLLSKAYIKAIDKYYSNDHFDCVLYSTPPITLVKAISYIKKRDNAKSYLMLKDIFPQNAVDLGMMRKHGVRSIVYKHFRKMEIDLYEISDKIGCMSPANVKYILDHNPFLAEEKVEVFPNCIEITDSTISDKEKVYYRKKYNLSEEKTICIYGGNLGKPQDIPFVIDCIKEAKRLESVYFVIIGSGTEYSKIEAFIKKDKPTNISLFSKIPRDDYNRLAAACDIGLIFLNHSFTIPNFPSRLLGYMQAALPVLCCTDKNSDIGKTVVEGGFGWWCESNSTVDFVNTLEVAVKSDLSSMKKKELKHLSDKFSVDDNCKKIIECCQKN